ncbi:MAG: NADH:ubiquinone reductase (Na(+)-transporting) subunit C [Tannerella forsythia]|uniref:NADH:ubiquinone reductase (Na(+)-transporting) subunit C n=1 Tax=Tannerella forsythia TaxID=28112 RepID=UPI0036242797
MNTNSNTYTVLYAAVMVVFVALLLAFTSQALRSTQKANEANDKRQQILRAVNVSVPAGEVEAKYNELIKEAFLVDADGQRTDGDAFAEEVEKAFARGVYPIFVATIDGQTKYILAMYGAGLWGPVWGYLSVNDDCNTVFGADFSHASETPGLGAEITSKAFSGQFLGKQLFRDGVFKSIAVVKSGNKVEGQDYVDGISGGTITSNGVNAMLRTSIGSYAQFLTTQKQ